MRLCPLVFLLCGPCLVSHQLPAQERERPTREPVGRAEIEQIEIVRWSVRDATKKGEMKIDLWFPATWEKVPAGFPHLIRLRSLSPIEDDTGKLLSTKDRLGQIAYLRSEVRGDTWRTGGGREGPDISFCLEAPQRRAEKIKAITGAADVSLAKVVSLTFSDLAAINGKELDHPRIKGLKDLKLRFSIEVKDGTVSATMQSPINFASPWNGGRLQEWALFDGGKEVTSFNESTMPCDESPSQQNDGVIVQRTFIGRRDFKGWSMRISVLEPVESKSFTFDLHGVELP
jgi:hypothetical protein